MMVELMVKLEKPISDYEFARIEGRLKDWEHQIENGEDHCGPLDFRMIISDYRTLNDALAQSLDDRELMVDEIAKLREMTDQSTKSMADRLKVQNHTVDELATRLARVQAEVKKLRTT